MHVLCVCECLIIEVLAITASQPDNYLFSPSLLLSHKVCLAAQASRHICNGRILFCPLWSRTGTRAIDSQCLLVMPDDERPGTGAVLHDTPLSVRSAVSYPLPRTRHQAMPEVRTARGLCDSRGMLWREALGRHLYHVQ